MAAVSAAQSTPECTGLLLVGSHSDGTADCWSDLDLVVIVDDEAEFASKRTDFASQIGSLLSCFTGEHVGEPRLLICLFDNPLRHVDIKFVDISSLRKIVEAPRLLWDRLGAVAAALEVAAIAWPARDLAWFEPRFWTWVHYVAAKVARGELFEAMAGLSLIREQVLGPVIGLQGRRRQRGLRRIEGEAKEWVPQLCRTVSPIDPHAIMGALQHSIAVYEKATDTGSSGANSQLRRAVKAYLEEVGPSLA